MCVRWCSLAATQKSIQRLFYRYWYTSVQMCFTLHGCRWVVRWHNTHFALARSFLCSNPQHHDCSCKCGNILGRKYERASCINRTFPAFINTLKQNSILFLSVSLLMRRPFATATTKPESSLCEH